MARRKIHLICNAHLDPIWLWDLDEGIGETLSTFGTAAELCDEFENFVFNHNEAILYEWVRKYRPEVFEKIQGLVREEKWHIMGGWYLQPDCNMPSGESFVRQILVGLRYFEKHFGHRPRTAINFDPFGHSQGLVQILAKSGFHSYLFGRPHDEYMKLANDSFVWKGFDGSEVLACRFDFPYCTDLGKARETLEAFIERHEGDELAVMLWGVGNHGGGPSRLDIQQINELIENSTEPAIVHSTPEAYFADLERKKDRLPRVDQSLNPWGPGCYSSMIRIKQKHRQLENMLYMAEKMASTAAVQRLMTYPKDTLEAAQEVLLLTQFHDVLPGSATPSVEESSLDRLGGALDRVRQVQIDAFLALAAGQEKAAAETYPVLVYNPHPLPMEMNVECEVGLSTRSMTRFSDLQVFHDGTPLLSQLEQAQSNMPLDWRKNVVFRAELQPGMNRFDCRSVTVESPAEAHPDVDASHIVFDNGTLHVQINRETGLIDRYTVNDKDYLRPSAFQPIIIQDSPNSWGSEDIAYRTRTGAFAPMSKKENAEFCGLDSESIATTRIIEDGPVRTIVEVLLRYNHSTLCQRYILSKHDTQMQVTTIVHWNEKDKMLKLLVPLAEKDDYSYMGQTAYGTAELPADGTEAVFQKFAGAVSRKNDQAVAIINDGIYAGDFDNSEIRVTLLRSPAYATHTNDFLNPHIKRNRYIPRQEQGRRVFNFWFDAGTIDAVMNNLDSQALVKNEKPYALCCFPPGTGPKAVPFARLDHPAVQVTAIKQAEDGGDYILRLFESTGQNRQVQLELPAVNRSMELAVQPFEIKTLRVNPVTREVAEADLLEEPLPRPVTADDPGRTIQNHDPSRIARSRSSSKESLY